MSASIKNYRCAIYTRKSHEEGLEQEFNSLDAQRESGEAYIQSQKHQNWSLIKKHYDDGGFSGGNIDRPALQSLLADIKHNKIDIILVYKVDRLSRSLGDFAKLMDSFDQHNVSFVSVTQQFNTTSSMGRLTLNMLLSFAQFEREVTGERIRDKFVASKKKGLWMGGSPPLGYRINNRKLEIIEEEAKTVRSIFEQKLAGKATLSIATELNTQGITTKAWVSQKGHARGGNRWTPKQIYRVLTNPIYIGKVKHKDALYKGEHQSMITGDVWHSVKNIMTKNTQPENKIVNEPFPLKTLVKTETGSALSPSTTKGIRYYVSQDAIKNGFKNCPIKSLNAKRLEELVMAHLINALPEIIRQYVLIKYQQSENAAWLVLRDLIFEVKITTTSIWISLQKEKKHELSTKLKQKDFHRNESSKDRVLSPFNIIYPSETIEDETHQKIRLDIQIKRHDGKRWILSKDGSPMIMNSHKQPSDKHDNNAILMAVAEAHVWKERLIKEQITVKQLAQNLSMNPNFIYKRLKLLSLSSTILKQITSNSLSPLISIKDLYQACENLCWQKQHQFLSFE
tara:strand:+ start:417 stop:2117 length:1701 start_codon:yes stop_codon:yes gene_type:complete